jgi:hypothetical protein
VFFWSRLGRYCEVARAPAQLQADDASQAADLGKISALRLRLDLPSRREKAKVERPLTYDGLLRLKPMVASEITPRAPFVVRIFKVEVV